MVNIKCIQNTHQDTKTKQKNTKSKQMIDHSLEITTHLSHRNEKLRTYLHIILFKPLFWHTHATVTRLQESSQKWRDIYTNKIVSTISVATTNTENSKPTQDIRNKTCKTNHSNLHQSSIITRTHAKSKKTTIWGIHYPVLSIESKYRAN